MQNNTPVPRYEDEISLTDLFLGLRAHWRAMLAAFAVVAILGIALASIWTNKYAYTAVLNIGGQATEGGFQSIESAGDVEAALNNAYLPAVIHELANGQGFVPSVTVDTPKSGGVVILKATGPASQADFIKQVLNASAQRVVERHDKQVAARKDAIESNYSSRLQALTERISSLESGVQAAGLSAADKAQMQDHLEGLKQQKVSVQEQLKQSLAAFQPTALAHTPQRSIKPVGIGAIAVALLALVLATMAALGAGLVAMFADAVRQRERELRAERSRANDPASLSRESRARTHTRVA